MRKLGTNQFPTSLPAFDEYAKQNLRNPLSLQANHAFKYRKNPRHTPSSPGVEVRWSEFQLISGLFSKPNRE